MADDVPTCPVCGASGRHKVTMPVDSKKFTPTAFGKIGSCDVCDVAFIYPRPSADETAEFYDLDSYYTHGKSHLTASVQKRNFFDRLRFHLAWRVDRGQALADVIDAGLGMRGASICDIGCGSGFLAEKLIEKGHQVVGVERDVQSTSLTNPSFRVLAGSVESLPAELKEMRFDAVVMSHVLEHVVDPVEAVRSAAALLAPGGQFYCAVPNNASTGAHRTGLSWEHLDVPRHLTFFTPASLRRTFESAGLTLERFFFEGYCRGFSPEWIETEQRIHDEIVRATSREPAVGTKNSRWQAWSLLARTAFAVEELKYDSVGLLARK